MEQNNGGMPVSLFGARLRMLRRRAKWTQQAVADRLSIHRTTYTKYETGVVTPDQQGLLKLAEIFGVTVDYLLGREETPARHVADDESRRVEVTLQEKVLLQMFRQLSPAEQKELVQQAQKRFREQKTRR
ncbi:MAG: helix-turn-helix transcriptional regulator [Clostridia bacterium]|nr:helix-turn-helix transcriptional regulator [Clostridia bacterium]